MFLETTPYIWMMCVGRVILVEFLCFIKCPWTASVTTIQPEANFAQISEALLYITSVLFNNIVGNCRLPIVGLHIALNAPIINPLNPELNPICYLLALLAHHFLHVSRIRVKSLPLRFLMSYIYDSSSLRVKNGLKKMKKLAAKVWLEVGSYHPDIFLEWLKKTAKTTWLMASSSIFKPVSVRVYTSSVPTWAYLLWILENINVFCSNFKTGELLCFELP